jgi:hypothetical protein
MPACIINHQDDVLSVSHLSAQKPKKLIHDFRIQNCITKSEVISFHRIHSSDHVAAFKPILPNDNRTRSFFCPDLRQNPFLAKPTLVLEPNFDFLVWMFFFTFFTKAGAFCFHSAMACGSFCGCRGRGLIELNPSR